MKTIKEAAREHASNAGYNVRIAADEVGRAVYEGGFKAGVEFAQRWIPIEEELPEIGLPVLVRNEDSSMMLIIVFKLNNYALMTNRLIDAGISYWRPIELP